MATINERIKEVRLKKHLTLKEVAEFLGIQEATAQRYESGSIKNIKYETICKLSELYECSPVYLMGWSDDLNAPISNSSNSIIAKGVNQTINVDNSSSTNIFQSLSKAEEELLRIYRVIDVRLQNKLLSFAYDLEDGYIKKNNG